LTPLLIESFDNSANCVRILKKRQTIKTTNIGKTTKTQKRTKNI